MANSQLIKVNDLYKQSISKETNNDIIILTIEIYKAGVKNWAGFATVYRTKISGLLTRYTSENFLEFSITNYK